MSNSRISTDRILNKLDEHLNKNDYASAESHLIYWLSEAEASSDHRTELLIRNELMGLYRKLGKKDAALECVKKALNKIEMLNIDGQVGSATTFLNSATVFKAFGMANDSISLFEKARSIYESKLDANDSRLGGLYNNMALSLSDLSRFSEAKELFNKAIAIMKANESYLEVAITLLNLATMAENELGIENACEVIDDYLSKAKELLENWKNRNGYYAFVCDKCASVYGYYGHFAYENELKERVRVIYEGA
jgi:tetratricopeptide (TPR) repeat protein